MNPAESGKVGAAVAATDPAAPLRRFFAGRPLEGFERSFKLAPGRLLDGRVLIGVARDAQPPEALFDLCRRLRMPEPFLEAFRDGLPGADLLHFGYEPGEGSFIHKVYLEYASRYHQALQSGSVTAAPLLLHLAYKWDALDPARRAVARYDCHPRLSLDAISARVQTLYAGRGANSPSHAAMRDVLTIAAPRCAAPPMYLEVHEAGNPRASFDINLHEAGLRVAEIAPLLGRLGAAYGVDAGALRAVLDAAGRDRLGHVAGGLGRDGADFFTVYHAPADPA